MKLVNPLCVLGMNMSSDDHASFLVRMLDSFEIRLKIKAGAFLLYPIFN